jgi:hypothetical protein
MPEPSHNFFVMGLDLGQVSDYSALAIDHQSGERSPRQHAIRYLRRWPLQTAYPEIVQDVATLAAKLPGCALCVDVTGVGRAVFDLFRRARIPNVHLIPITITGGAGVKPHALGGWSVAKGDLVSTTQAALQTGRLGIAADLPESQMLVQELQVFTAKVNLRTANVSFEAWREKDHDDLVLAVALAVWFGEWGRRRLTVFA